MALAMLEAEALAGAEDSSAFVCADPCNEYRRAAYHLQSPEIRNNGVWAR